MWMLGLTIALLAATYIFMPTPRSSNNNVVANSMDDFTFPTNSNTTPVSEVFGTVKIGGNILWYGDLSSKPIKKSS